MYNKLRKKQCQREYRNAVSRWDIVTPPPPMRLKYRSQVKGYRTLNYQVLTNKDIGVFFSYPAEKYARYLILKNGTRGYIIRVSASYVVPVKRLIKRPSNRMALTGYLLRFHSRSQLKHLI